MATLLQSPNKDVIVTYALLVVLLLMQDVTKHLIRSANFKLFKRFIAAIKFFEKLYIYMVSR